MWRQANDNVGRKRNTGVQALIDQGVDVIVRIGSDDVSPALPCWVR